MNSKTSRFGLASCFTLVLGGIIAIAAPGCNASGVGDPCVPEQEYNATFTGFNVKEVNIESKSFQCQTRLCLVNHFQGRVNCPYGQKADGTAPAGAESCKTPDGADVEGDPASKDGKLVQPQCKNRRPNDAVYCSCRCANEEGKTDDGAVYCECPDGFSCTQLVTSIGAGDRGLTGAYCIKDKTKYDANTACTSTCNPALENCKD